MGTWEERFDNHGIHNMIGEARGSLETARSAAETHHPEDQAVHEGLSRVEAVVARLEERLSGADRLFVAESTLKSLHQNLATIRNELNAYASDKSTGHIDSANKSTDGIAAFLPQLQPPITPEEVHGLGEAAAGFRQRIEALTKGVQGDVESLQEAASEIRERLDDLKEETERQARRLERTVDDHNEQFSQAQERRREEATETLKEIEEQARKREAERTKEHDAALAAVRQSHEEELAGLQALRDKAQKLVDATVHATMAEAYRKVADDAEKRAGRWQWITIAGFLLSALLATALIVGPWFFDVEPPTWDVRISVSVALVALAGFAYHQTAHYHGVERENRKRQLQFASLDPYIANFTETEQKAIKERVMPSIFGISALHEAPKNGMNGKEETSAEQAVVRR